MVYKPKTECKPKKTEMEHVRPENCRIGHVLNCIVTFELANRLCFPSPSTSIYIRSHSSSNAHHTRPPHIHNAILHHHPQRRPQDPRGSSRCPLCILPFLVHASFSNHRVHPTGHLSHLCSTSQSLPPFPPLFSPYSRPFSALCSFFRSPMEVGPLATAEKSSIRSSKVRGHF